MNAKKKFAKFATCKKKLIFTVWVSFFWRQLNPSIQSIYISQIITHYVSTLENRSLRYTSCQL